jgi:hypothetical protein
MMDYDYGFLWIFLDFAMEQSNLLEWWLSNGEHQTVPQTGGRSKLVCGALLNFGNKHS